MRVAGYSSERGECAHKQEGNREDVEAVTWSLTNLTGILTLMPTSLVDGTEEVQRVLSEVGVMHSEGMPKLLPKALQ